MYLEQVSSLISFLKKARYDCELYDKKNGDALAGKKLIFLRAPRKGGANRQSNPVRQLHPPLVTSLSHARFLSIRSRTQAVGRASSCQLVFLALQQDTNHFLGPIHDFASRTHDIPQIYIRVHPHTCVTPNRQPPADRARERAHGCSAAKCYLTNHLADPWPETPSSRGLQERVKADVIGWWFLSHE